MADKGIGDYFISDADDEAFEDDELLGAPVVVPVVPQRPQPVPVPEPMPAVSPMAPPPIPVAPTRVVPVAPQAYEPPVPVPAPQPYVTAPQATREELLAKALDDLLREDADIQAAALVSLDGFTMASALPEGMQADRVGAMSAAILGLGERAAAELGRGHLSQVFIEGSNGYVLLIAAGNRAVLTAMADSAAKLGLVLYDMKSTAQRIGRILG
ncbi:MAG: roadblock/LC7 domain-containing protein [Coriobacteriia bacterium]